MKNDFLKKIKDSLKFSNKKQKLTLIGVLVLVISVPLGVLLLQKFVLYRSRAAGDVELCFGTSPCPNPQSYQLLTSKAAVISPTPVPSTNTPIPVYLNSGTKPFFSIALTINFDKTKVKFHASPVGTSSSLQIQTNTDINTANANGVMAVYLRAPIGATSVSGSFQFLNLPMDPVTPSTAGTQTTLTIDPNSVSIVDPNYNLLSPVIPIQFATLTIDPILTEPLTCASGQTLKVIAPCAQGILNSNQQVRIYDLTFLNSLNSYTITQATFQGRGLSSTSTNYFALAYSASCPTTLIGGTIIANVAFPYSTTFQYYGQSSNPTGYPYLGGLVQISSLNGKFLSLVALTSAVTFGTETNLHMCVSSGVAATNTPGPTATTAPTATNTPVPTIPQPTPTTGISPTATPVPTNGGGMLIIDPVSTTKAPNEIFTSQIRFRTGDTLANARGISAITFRITYPYSGTSPELEIVDAAGTPGRDISPNSALISTTNWAFPVNSVTRSNGLVTIDFSAVYTSSVPATGFSTIVETPLASIRFKAVRKPLTNPITLTWSYINGVVGLCGPGSLTSLTGIFTKSDPVCNILSQPLNAQYSIVDTATLAYSFKMQGISSAITRNATTLFFEVPYSLPPTISQTYTLNVVSDANGLFSPSPSPVTLTNLPVSSTGSVWNVFQKAPGYLRKRLSISGVLTLYPGWNPLPSPSVWATGQRLLAGDFVDASGNPVTYNVLNINDIGLMLSSQVYNQLTVPVTSVFLSQFDIDGNNVINVIDIAYVLSNFTQLNVPGD